MTRNLSQIRISFAIAGCLSLALAVSRCSPLAPSVPKFGARGGSAGDSSSNFAKTSLVHILPFRGSLVEHDPRSSDSMVGQPGQEAPGSNQARVTYGSDSEQVKALREGVMARVTLNGIPSSVEAIFEIELEAGELLEDFEPGFKTQLEAQQNGEYLLGLHPSMSHEDALEVRSRLKRVVLAVTLPGDPN